VNKLDEIPRLLKGDKTSIDYIHENSEVLRTELSILREKIKTLKGEQESAIRHDVGLEGPVTAAEKEISSLQATMFQFREKNQHSRSILPFF